MKRQETPRVGQKIAEVSSEGGGLVAKMSLWLQQQLRLLGRNPVADVVPLTVTGSPMTYLNDTDFDQDVAMAGGTVTGVEFSRDGVAYFPLSAAGLVRLNPGDRLRATYTAAPTITVIPR